MLVLNAANVQKKYKWINSLNKNGVYIENISDKTGLLALQGPKSRKILKILLDLNFEKLGYYNFIETKISSISTSPERDDTILIENPFEI